MVIRVAEVSVVEKPYVSDIENLVVWAVKELREVLARLKEIREPNHGREISLSSMKELASKLNLLCILLISGLYFYTRIKIKST